MDKVTVCRDVIVMTEIAPSETAELEEMTEFCITEEVGIG